MTTRMKDADLNTGFAIMTSRHRAKVSSDREYFKVWMLKNAMAQNLRNKHRPPITLPRVMFMERPELFPEI